MAPNIRRTCSGDIGRFFPLCGVCLVELGTVPGTGALDADEDTGGPAM